MDEETVNLMRTSDIMKALDIPLEKASSDLSRDRLYGDRLPELGKSTSQIVANGRVPPDKGIGKPTTNHGTTADYLIGSSSLLASIDKFEIHDFDPLFF